MFRSLIYLFLALFLNLGIYKKPKYQWKNPLVPEYYESVDFYLGAEILINGRVLVICRTDDYSLKYMEKNCHKFIHSSIERILMKLRKPLTSSKHDIEYFFKIEDPNHEKLIFFNSLKKFKNTFADNLISLQELVTLARYYSNRDIESDKDKNLKTIAKIRDSLRRTNFVDFYVIKEHWYSESPKSTKLSIEKAESILKGMKFPLSGDLICELLNLSKDYQSDEVDLCNLLAIIEWQKFQPDYYDSIARFLDCDNWLTSRLDEPFENQLKIGRIEYEKLLIDIFNEPQISKTHPSAQKMLGINCSQRNEDM